MKRVYINFMLTILISSINCFADEASTTQSTASALKVGDTFKVYELEDAHHVKHALKPETRLVLMSFEMDLSKSIHAWLEKKEPGFLEKNKLEYVADITEMPGIITYLFARPKMQKYPFQILLADDDKFASQFPVEEGKFVVFEIDENRVVKNVTYFQSPEELEAKYFSSEKTAPVAVPSPTPQTKK